MSQPLCLSIDVGTHSCRAALISRRGEFVWSQSVSYGLNHRAGNKVEQNPHDIVDGLVGLLQSLPDTSLKCAGIACQRSTVVSWDGHSGRANHPALSWMDTRGADQLADVVKNRTRAERIKQISGLQPSAHYGATKLSWLLQHEATASGSHVAPLVSFILWHLIADHPYLLDETNAGRTQLWDVHQRHWSDALTSFFDIASESLPHVQPSQSHFGFLAPDLISDSHSAPCPVYSVAGDQNAAYYGARLLAGFDPGLDAVVNLGTGGFILAEQFDDQPEAYLLHTLGWSQSDQTVFLLEGTVNGAGAALQWLIHSTELFGKETEQEFYQCFDSRLAHCSGDLIFLNTVGGLGSPFWHATGEPQFADSKGTIIPDSDFHKFDKAEWVGAVVFSIIALVNCNLEHICRHRPVVRLWLSGGLSRSETFCQWLADLSGCTVEVARQKEATLLGSAAMAFDACDRLSESSLYGDSIQSRQEDEYFTQTTGSERTFIPDEKSGGKLRNRYNTFLALLSEMTGHDPAAN